MAWHSQHGRHRHVEGPLGPPDSLSAAAPIPADAATPGGLAQALALRDFLREELTRVENFIVAVLPVPCTSEHPERGRGWPPGGVGECRQVAGGSWAGTATSCGARYSGCFEGTFVAMRSHVSWNCVRGGPLPVRLLRRSTLAPLLLIGPHPLPGCGEGLH